MCKNINNLNFSINNKNRHKMLYKIHKKINKQYQTKIIKLHEKMLII